MHLSSADNRNNCAAIWSAKGDWPGDDGYLCAGFNSGGGDGITHLSGTVVADIAHRIYSFAGGAGGDHNFFATQLAALKTVGDLLDNIIGLLHAPFANIATGLNAIVRTENQHISLLESSAYCRWLPDATTCPDSWLAPRQLLPGVAR